MSGPMGGGMAVAGRARGKEHAPKKRQHVLDLGRGERPRRTSI